MYICWFKQHVPQTETANHQVQAPGLWLPGHPIPRSLPSLVSQTTRLDSLGGFEAQALLDSVQAKSLL